MFSSDCERVKLTCRNEVIDAIIDKFGEEVIIDIVDDNTFEVVVEIAVSHIFYSWIFGFGGKVKIKSPDYIIKVYREMVKNEMNSIS